MCNFAQDSNDMKVDFQYSTDFYGMNARKLGLLLHDIFLWLPCYYNRIIQEAYENEEESISDDGGMALKSILFAMLKKSMSVFSKVLPTVREDGWRTNNGRTDTEQ